jgi:hypothetical protein
MVIFPDVERLLVAGLNTALAARSETYASNVLVTTKKPAADATQPARCIVIRADGGPTLDDVRKSERVGITIWANTYADASDLAHLVAALSKSLTGEHIKKVDVSLSPTRLGEENRQEARYLILELIVKGSNL